MSNSRKTRRAATKKQKPKTIRYTCMNELNAVTGETPCCEIDIGVNVWEMDVKDG